MNLYCMQQKDKKLQQPQSEQSTATGRSKHVHVLERPSQKADLRRSTTSAMKHAGHEAQVSP